MSVKERPKKNKEESSETKKSKTVDEWLDNVSVDEVDPMLQTETVVDSTPKVEEITQEDLERRTQKFQSTLPSWTSKPWMYVQPTNQSQLKSWLDSWSKVILEFSRIMTIHVININELITIHPFKNNQNSKQLTNDQVLIIVDDMVSSQQAKWLDENKILVRIYFKTNDQWSGIIMKHLMDTGLAAEVLTLYELEKLNQDWSSLPRQELVEIFDILVSKNRAQWVGDSKDALTFIL
ncbi:MAG: hypothetical protein ACW98K_16985 [Candidatus Kariarchaeaceae archaeon]|jgi:hypothetical protein